MGILESLKQEAKKGGSALGKIFYVKENDKKRVRFLTDLDEGVEIPWLSCYEKKVACPNPEYFGMTNPYKHDQDIKNEKVFMWQVYDYDANDVKPLIYKHTQCTPVPHLLTAYSTYGTLKDRDYVISCTGSSTSKTMPVMPLDKAKFQQLAKPLTQKQLNKIIKDAYLRDLDEVEQEEADYTQMTARELYNLCEKREIEAEPKMNKPYYVNLLEEWDEQQSATHGYNEAEEDDWGEEDTKEQDYESMKPQELYKLCKEQKIEAEPRQKKQYYIDLLTKTEDDNDEWADEDEWVDLVSEADEMPWGENTLDD